MAVPLTRVAEGIEAFAPLGLAESWDRPGLQVGDPEAPVETVLTALDPSPRAVDEARRNGAQLLLTHHPLLLVPLPRLDLSTPLGRLIRDCVSSGLSIYSCHTNLDRADGGVNDRLAERLGLREVEPLGVGIPLVKVVVTVPVGYEPRVRSALYQAGAGNIGHYAGCSFACRGVGSFEPRAGARPFAGSIGRRQEVEETRLETVLPRDRLESARRAVANAHPYEEAVVDGYPLENASSRGAPGRVGNLVEPRSLGHWAVEVGELLGAPGIRTVGAPGTMVSRVAVCAGSGSFLWEQARRAGAQVLVTGDVKHHMAREAEAAGLCLVDAGHAATEAVAVECLADVVRGWSDEREAGLEIIAFREPDPFSWTM